MLDQLRHWICFVFLLSASSFLHCGYAQTGPVNHPSGAHLETSPHTSSKMAHGFSRFVGWRYAAIAQQDTSRWQRYPERREAPVTKGIRGTSSHLAVDSLSSVSSFPYAGFAAPDALPTGYLPTAVVQGDFNEDGVMDLAISNGGDNTVYVLIGTRDGTFKVPEILYTTGQAPAWITGARMHTNGHLDLIVVDGDSEQVELFTGNGDGTFQPSSVIATLTQTPTFVLAEDFNQDGNIDLAVGLVVPPLSTKPQFKVLLGNGGGSFPSSIVPPSLANNSDYPIPASWIAAGDLNKDGLMDIVLTTATVEALTFLNQ
jgi:hypothetical protein